MPTPPVIEEIDFGSEGYRTVLDFRDRILRQPLGMRLSETDTEGEEVQRHFVLRQDGEILAGVIAVARKRGTVQLRQMWVRDDTAGRGLGRSLLEGVERILAAEGLDLLTLHARVVVRGFYERCGYTPEGEEFEEIGLPHIVMSRRIGNG
ncbi:GCN5 family acetyltransferase [Haloferula helveola]|uniref:GCN5 family acetyltransferase n=1 Tax=Haloferula helveola TaxID=490095 RepID=A0ABN6H280_9BACT|nr:GCN5 family acetyltransferase [Haloferula helveola]